ncbi:hypothetical protein LOK49_LG12G00158 [Camellia lanceoleosa]|uniref:Uncharacterized protein n=1 Tax=Camellia lanceoleosa TaxID=1840588 RepID=A0ACC0FV50_9ERIC|nr:hypothetical protein LOK49_LG12G00158 [Camellia lanceoleosa]
MSEFQQGLPQLRLPTIIIKPSTDETPTIQTPKSDSNSDYTDDECRTLTSPEHKIPSMLSCPLIPKKPRRTEHFNFGSVFVMKRILWCLKVIELLQSCCEKCDYKSTHCASLSGILKQRQRQPNEELSHMLYVATDMVLVHSIYEPCGLAQMIGMRYGTVPIVRKTGGLADTVFDMDDELHAEMTDG